MNGSDIPSITDPRQLTEAFYEQLRLEVREGRASLTPGQLERLQGHYPVMMTPERYPIGLVTTIYAQRRAPAVEAIRRSERPVVFDAGCGFGSESYLFAALGAEVVAVDAEEEKIEIARARQPYFEELFGRRLTIRFETADLDIYTPPVQDLSLTWIASVLANIPRQDAFLERLYQATRPGGEVMVTDMNLLNPLFVWKEWRRRRAARAKSPEFAHQASFSDMFWRKNRRGARYFPVEGPGDPFDDAQFFWPRTLARLFRQKGFVPGTVYYSGFVPPVPGLPDLSRLEPVLDRIPLLRRGAYFYRMSGIRAED